MLNHSFLIILAFMSGFINIAASSCNKELDNPSTGNNTIMANGKIKITVNSKIFTATLLDNNSAKAFKEMLPMTISMKELNGDEKYYDLPERLPTEASNPGTTKTGDLMLFGSRTLVLFYKNHSTSYSYTRLGKVDDTTDLASILGSGNATITFELK